MRHICSAMTYLSAMALLAACGNDDEAAPQSGMQNVAIQFAAQANGADVKCGAVNELANIGLTKKTTQVQDLRFYVSKVQLVNQKGQAVDVALTNNDFQNYGVALLDFEDATGACAEKGTATLNTTVTGQVPADTYTGIKFTLGVPDTGKNDSNKDVALNHSNTTAMKTPLNVTEMAWSWQGGRKFVKIELAPNGGVINQKATPDTADDATITSWMLHLGATGCTGSETAGYSCTNANLNTITFNGFNVATQKVVLDVPALFAQADIGLNKNSAPGCMSGTTDNECPAIFDALGIDLATGQPSTTKTQTVFKVVNK